MEGLEFYKMSGHGNDFILVDNREKKVPDDAMVAMAKAACRRRLSIGADGMIFIEHGPPGVDFAWRFFNSDGSEAEMCGNGSRCAARFAYIKEIARAQMKFMTLAGIIRADDEIYEYDQAGKPTFELDDRNPAVAQAFDIFARTMFDQEGDD